MNEVITKAAIETASKAKDPAEAALILSSMLLNIDVDDSSADNVTVDRKKLKFALAAAYQAGLERGSPIPEADFYTK